MTALEFIAALVGVLTGLGTLGGCLWQLGRRVMAFKRKLDIVWEFLCHRSASEAVAKGIGEMRAGKLAVEVYAKSWLAHMADELQAFYRREGRGLAETDLLLAIERQFGERLVQEVCIPYRLTDGACLLIAAQVAKDGE